MSGLSQGYIVIIRHNDVVRQLNAYGLQRHGNLFRCLNIFIGRQCHTAGMIVGKDHAGSIGSQGRFHDFSGRYTRAVDTSLTHLFAAKHLALGIQAQEVYRFLCFSEEKRQHILGTLLQGEQGSIFGGTVDQVKPSHFGYQMQQRCRIFSDTLHLAQFLHRGFQHLRKGAKVIQKCMCNGIGILTRDAVKQQQFQGLNIGKTVQPVFQKLFLKPLSVSIMDRHIFHLTIAIFPFIR